MKNITGLFLLLTLIMSCSVKTIDQKKITSLDQNWEFSKAGEDKWYPATVPGTVHTDLMANHLIPDPFIGFNEDSVQWIENQDWIYRTSFNLGKDDLDRKNIELVFDGLDTYADVYLNDSLVISADNMFIPWQTDCKKYLREGINNLRIYFRSPVRMGMEKLEKLGYPLIATNEQAPDDKKTNVFTRKAPFHYGWDWGPRLVTSGIWRPVYLQSWDKLILRDIRMIQDKFSPQECTYTVELEVESSGSGKYPVNITADGQNMAQANVGLNPGMNKVGIGLTFKNPELWWTNGLGNQKLYKIGVAIGEPGRVMDSKSLNLGIRKLELVQEPDSVGRSFYFRVNGVPVFMKGSNYIPGDILTPRVTPEKYERVVKEAKDANMNMLRVWGGAIYENDIFFDLCDKYGILVWHDFMFACALQPGDQHHLDNIRKEAEYNVKRLRNHPCMALWCGNNENLIAWYNWGWQKNYTPEQRDFLWKTYQNIFYKILPDAVKENDPGISYWPSSPQSYGDKLPDRKSGDEHDWSVWFGPNDFKDYGNNIPRFVSEYGLQSFPQMSTLLYFGKPADMTMFSKLFDRRQRSRMDWIKPGFNGNDMQLRYVRQYFPEPQNLETFIYLSQITHQLAMKEAVEAHRRNMPVCMGSLYWQINDCWPTISWATVDYFGNWKASHYQAKRSFENLILAPDVRNGKVDLYVVSDNLTDKEATLQLSWMTTGGKVTGTSDSRKITIRGNTSEKIFSAGYPEKECHSPSNSTYLVARLFDGNILLTEKLIPFCKPKDETLHQAAFNKLVTKSPDGYDITLSSKVPARFVHIDYPEVKGFFADNYFNLIPGTVKTIHFQTDETISDPSGSLKIECLNNL